VERSFRNRLVLANAAIVVVIALMAATAILALRSTREQLDASRQLDQRLAIIDHLRSSTRALALSARRFMLSGDLKEQQRVFAIVHEMKGERERLDARRTLDKGAILEADIAEYVAALTHAMSFDDDDPIVRFSRFEDELVRIRGPLASTFDEIISRERAKGDALRSAQTLAHGAQWAVLIASILGIVLVVGTSMARPPGTTSSADDPSLTRSRNDVMLRREPLDAATLVDRAVRAHREAAHARGVRLRYDAQLAVRIVADRERIEYVLDTLLQIAIAAVRPAAELVVHIAAAEGGVRFAISEPGPAIDVHEQHDVTLQLCRPIIEAHGGRIGVHASSISRTYWFTLPSEPALLR
jgi:signal transduction histidine kinase